VRSRALQISKQLQWKNMTKLCGFTQLSLGINMTKLGVLTQLSLGITSDHKHQ